MVYDLDDDDLYDLDDGDSKDDELDCLDGVDWGTHSRTFDYLSFASGIVVNGLSHRQLRSFRCVRQKPTDPKRNPNERSLVAT